MTNGWTDELYRHVRLGVAEDGEVTRAQMFMREYTKEKSDVNRHW